MAKKRKSENAALDEVERSLYTSFCTAANSISQLYTQAQNQQKIAFQAGERHAVEKLYQWLLREHQTGSNITVAQIIHNLQSELENGNGDEMTMSPGPQVPQQPVVGTSGRTAALSAPIDQGKISVFQGALSSPNRRSIPSFAMAPAGYGVQNASVQPARRGSLSLEQPAADLREDQLESAPYEDAPAVGFGFQPPQPQHQHQHQHQHPHHHHQHQHQQQNQHQQHPQHVRGGAHTYNENDASMDMHADGAAESYYR
ncbi:hypothetical protein KC19_9G019200 [Ceratodon purpureus]|uniref:Holocarboxylase synthetase n=1 Tax=Ceratodon purpureus TaxID=3225 RepID=A0A8T0GRQ2_CERPU|nr:hypothetical protein KC19_9G019200 [Ceratodon purpureus]